ncbi:glycosyltransferase family 2 protein [Dysgonomonas sp. 37-18]|uniref:glycosyltransferase n=1 Tax=Dysgonomonas sp. 37-18 TaxID=1895907 RepID=UPI00092947C9|nr:glycosyltransferase family 2 protein [Dysgonomonas sp. 37-18]OJX64869.1 MAG: glycosyl transferase [Dysgonomonas sp. 37-18]
MNVVNIVDSVLFALMLFPVLYLLVFAIASLKKRKIHYPETENKLKYVILFPAYKEDKVIVSSVKSFLTQDYPKSHFDVVVISDQLKDKTNEELSQLPVDLLIANYKDSTKAKALIFALDNLSKDDYDAVVIIDADNTVSPNFLNEINKAFSFGIRALQVHRIAKDPETDMAILDAASEEMNNSFFRSGHIRLGLSSALSGSGMAFEYKWFKKNINNISSVGEDKELELQLLRQGIYIDYLEDVFAYDQKVQNQQVFYNQRRRWMASQYENLVKGMKYISEALTTGNIDLCNKLIQWAMLPRLILLGLIFVLAVLFLLINIFWSIKWWILLMFMCLSLAIAIPDEMVNERLIKILRKLPKLFILMVINLFRIKGAKKKFIHTEH